MNTKGFRRMLFGEKMPDKNDPKYKDRYEQDSLLRERHKEPVAPIVEPTQTRQR